jgi:hypothetical protein
MIPEPRIKSIDDATIEKLARQCESSPALAGFIEAAIAPERLPALAEARAKLRRPAWYIRLGRWARR